MSLKIKYLGTGEVTVSAWGYEIQCGCGTSFPAYFPMIIAASGIATCDKCGACYSINQVTLNDAIKDPKNHFPELVLVQPGKG